MNDIKPVAWRVRFPAHAGMIGHYPWGYQERAPLRGSVEVQALYAAADVAELVRALGEALDVARDHIAMSHLESSHCNDAERIRSAVERARAFLAQMGEK